MSETMAAFEDSAELLADPPALRARFDADGYVLLRGVVDRDALRDLHGRIIDVIDRRGWLRPGTDRRDAIVGDRILVEGDTEYLEVYDEIQRMQAFHALPHHPSVRRGLEALLGPDAFPHPLSICRLMFPRYGPAETPPHQDFPNNQGTEDLYVSWIPLTDITGDMGGLAVLAGSHRLGVLPLEFSLGPGHRQAVLDERHEPLRWVAGDLAAGDVLIFHSLTVHRARPNRSDRMRISVDYRFQREGEPLTQRCLQPHFGRLDWPEIYRDWADGDLQFYWWRRRFEVVPFDDSYHAMSQDALDAAAEVFRAAQAERVVPARPDRGRVGRLRQLRSGRRLR